MTRIWIKSITLNNGSTLSFDKNDIIVFVGPNNSGKSVTLKEINQLLKNENPGKIVKRIEIVKDGTESEFIKYLSDISVKKETAPNNQNYSGINYNVEEKVAKQNWLIKNSLANIYGVFVNFLSTEARLSAANPPQSIELRATAPSHPIHWLQKNSYLEEEFNIYFRKAFGTDLVLDRNAGSKVPLRVGEKPKLEESEDRLSPGYDKKLGELPELQNQGDGMRSYVGVLLNTFIAKYSIQLIDEPEIFLHPPQVKLLGEMLGKNIPHDCQLFLTTHSEDFLKGLLDSKNENIRIIRIRREGDINLTHQLNKDDINEIWSDSLLKHSNLLSGLFHKKVILCESESDCKFYSAILSTLLQGSEITNPDMLFFPCGGKGKIPMVVQSLKKLDIPIIAVVDFDVLEMEAQLKNIFIELHGDWDKIKDHVIKIQDYINSIKQEPLEKEKLKSIIESILNTIDGEVIPDDKIAEITKNIKNSKFSEAKRQGVNIISCNKTKEVFNKLNTICKESNLIIVEVGELESFVKSINGHGTKWVNEVLNTKELKTDEELKSAREFVELLLN